MGNHQGVICASSWAALPLLSHWVGTLQRINSPVLGVSALLSEDLNLLCLQTACLILLCKHLSPVQGCSSPAWYAGESSCFWKVPAPNVSLSGELVACIFPFPHPSQVADRGNHPGKGELPMPCVPSLGAGSSPMDVCEPSKGTQGQETPQGPGDTSALLGSGGCWNYAVRCPRTMTYYQILGSFIIPRTAQC